MVHISRLDDTITFYIADPYSLPLGVSFASRQLGLPVGFRLSLQWRVRLQILIGSGFFDGLNPLNCL